MKNMSSDFVARTAPLGKRTCPRWSLIEVGDTIVKWCPLRVLFRPSTPCLSCQTTCSNTLAAQRPFSADHRVILVIWLWHRSDVCRRNVGDIIKATVREWAAVETALKTAVKSTLVTRFMSVVNCQLAHELTARVGLGGCSLNVD